MSDAAINRQPTDVAEEIHLGAYNAAFYELGLRWYWDAATYQTLQRKAAQRDCVRVYLESEQPHLLKAYDAEFLIEAIQAAKARCYDSMMAGSGIAPKVDWAAMQAIQVGV
jgi:hypothetical protein